jgi:hypothetical protein
MTPRPDAYEREYECCLGEGGGTRWQMTYQCTFSECAVQIPLTFYGCGSLRYRLNEMDEGRTQIAGVYCALLRLLE